MFTHLLERLAWMLPTLLGISLVTFLMLDLLPVDAAAARLAQTERLLTDDVARERALRELRSRDGRVDPETGELRPFVARWATWMGRAIRLDVAPPGESPAAFRARIGAAVAVSASLGLAAAAVALLFGVAAGAVLGTLAGRRGDRLLSPLLLALAALPEFLIGTVVLLAIGALGVDGWPIAGLGTPGSEGWPWHQRLVDAARHALLPVLVLAATPAVWAARLVRDAVSRTSGADWVTSEAIWGVPRRHTRVRIVANSLRPVWTWLGTVVPMLVTSTLVVEKLFQLPGIGQVTLQAVLARDVTTITVVTLYTAVLVLIAMVLADLGLWAADRRVRLG